MIDIIFRKKITNKLRKLDTDTYENFKKLLDDALSQLKKEEITRDDYLQQTNQFYEKICTVMEYLDTYKSYEEYRGINQHEAVKIIIEAMEKQQKFNASKIKTANYQRDILNIKKKFNKAKEIWERNIKEIEDKLGVKYPMSHKLDIPAHPNDNYKYALTKLQWEGLSKADAIILLEEALRMENPKITKKMKEDQYEYLDIFNRMIEKAIKDGKTTKEEESEDIKTLEKARKAIDNNKIFILKD